MIRATLYISLLLFGFFVASPTVMTVHAASEQHVSRSYKTQGTISPGNVVALENDSGETVILANTNNADRTVGIAVRSNESILDIQPSETLQQVATSGVVQVMVNTANGPIKSGDKVAVSALSGTAQKSSPGDFVVGFARTDFAGDAGDVSTATLTAKSGETKEVKVGFIEVELAIGAANPVDTTESLNGLQEFVRSLTGKSVSTARIIASIVIALLTLLSLTALLYASIYGSIISIGRNPLARSAILRGLVVVLVMAGLGVLLSLSVIYLLLR